MLIIVAICNLVLAAVTAGVFVHSKTPFNAGVAVLTFGGFLFILRLVL